MYLYLGQETVINTDDIVGIFDLENTSTARSTKSFLKASQKRGYVTAVTNELPKSFVLCSRDGKHDVYLSIISPSTLKKRTGFLKNLEGH